ncbi:hypothetical protein ACVIW3_002959 [Bradyrhizobium diazoefficiens]
MRHTLEVANASHLTTVANATIGAASQRFALRERQKRTCTKTAKDS